MTKPQIQIIACALLLVCVCSQISVALAGEDPHLYATGSIMEVDRCASAWLIKRYVDPEAEFVFFKDGQLIDRGIAFDTPDARFSRTHNQATFEVLIHHYGIKDPKVVVLAAAIHQIEINYWAGALDTQAADLVHRTNAIIKANTDPAQCLQKCFELYDQIAAQIMSK